MNLKYKTSTLALTIAGFLAVEAHLSTAQAQIDEIIVTARKREQSLQTVPIAVSAFSGTQLLDASITKTDQLGELVPNLNIFIANVGLRATLRGQTINEGLISEDPSVNLNIDGVYIARPHAGNIPFVDVAQIEVLRGPQGTLFGRNTTGGAINITTKLPEYEWGGEVGGRLANMQRGDVWGTLNVPIIEDRLAVRGALSLKNAGGLEDEKGLLNGTSPFDEDSKTFFGSLLWEPTDSLDVVVRGNWGTEASHYYESTHLVNVDAVGTGGGAALLGGLVAGMTGAAPAPGTGVTPLLPCSGAFGSGTFCSLSELFDAVGTNYELSGGELPIATNQEAANHRLNDTAGVSLTTTWEGELLNIKAQIAKRWIEQSSFFDLDGTPLGLLATEQMLDHDQFSAEIQFYGDFDLFGRNLDWIGGAFYFEEEALQGSITDIFGKLNPRSPQMIRGIGKNDSVAGFAELDYEVIEDFRITMGGRYTVDTKYASNSNTQGMFPSVAAATPLAAGRSVVELPADWLALHHQGDALTTADLLGKDTSVDRFSICRIPDAIGLTFDEANCFIDAEETFSAFSWNFGWDWQAWQDGSNAALIYANYKRSFRSGGQNFRAFQVDNSFDPEFVRQIAAGLKLDLLDGNLRFNVEGFHQDISDKQVVTVVAIGGGLTTIVSNAASANVKGVEFEMNWTPLPDTLSGLQLNGSLGWTDPVYNSFQDFQPADPSLPVGPANPIIEVSRANEPFARVTDLSANASIVYNHAVWDSCDGNLLMRLDWSFKSDTAIEETAEIDANKPGFGPLAEMSTGDYFLVNARSALSLWDGGIELGVWCRNCTDTQYIAGALDLRDSFGYAVAQPSIPRTFGGDLTYRWGAGR